MDVDSAEGHRRSRRVANRSPNKALQLRAGFEAGSALSASCNFCKQRHIRCDGKAPCSQCTKRGLACQYGIRAKTGPKPRVNSDSVYQQLYADIQLYKQRADYWRNKFLNFKAQLDADVVALQSPISSSSHSLSSSDGTSRQAAKLAARRAIKESRRSIWSSALATMTYLTNLELAGGMVHACYFEDSHAPTPSTPLPHDHTEFSRAPDTAMSITDDAPNQSRVSLALDLFETSIAPLVTDYKLQRSLDSAMSIWNMTVARACQLDAASLILAFEHSVALAMSFSVMQDFTCCKRYSEQMETLLRLVFFPREIHMLLQYADKMAQLLIHILMLYSGDDKVGRRQTIVMLAYQIVSLHRPFISQSSMHRIFLTMMTYATNHRDRQAWMAEAMNCEASPEFNEVFYFKHAFHIFYVFCSIHPRMSYEMPRPNYGFKELFGFLQILEYAALKLSTQGSEFSALANAFPDIALSFHLFIHGTRAECLFLLGDHRLALRLAQWVIESATSLENPNWQLLFALQSSLEICFVMKQLEWVYRAVHLLSTHSKLLPLAITFNERNQKILNIHLPPDVAESLAKATKERLEAETDPAEKAKRAVKNWKDIMHSTPPLEHVQLDLDVNSVILREPTIVDEHPSDPLCISNMLARSVLDGTIASTMAHQLGIRCLKDETMIPPVLTGSTTKPSSAQSHGAQSASNSKHKHSPSRDIDDEDVQALLSIGTLLETVEDDTLNTELSSAGVYSHGKSHAQQHNSSSPRSPALVTPPSPARNSNTASPKPPVASSLPATPTNPSTNAAPTVPSKSPTSQVGQNAQNATKPNSTPTDSQSPTAPAAHAAFVSSLIGPNSGLSMSTSSASRNGGSTNGNSNFLGATSSIPRMSPSNMMNMGMVTSATGNVGEGGTERQKTLNLSPQPILPTTLPADFPTLSPIFPTHISPSQLTSAHLAAAGPTGLGGLGLPLINSYLLPPPYILRPPVAHSFAPGCPTGPGSPMNTPNAYHLMSGFPGFPAPYQPPNLHAGNMQVPSTTASFSTILTSTPGSASSVPMPKEFSPHNTNTAPPPFPASFGTSSTTSPTKNNASAPESEVPPISLFNSAGGSALAASLAVAPH